MNQSNVRFWDYVNGGLVKITLRHDKSRLRHWQSRRTDEGWSAEGETWWADDGVLYIETIADGCDCDGRLTQTALHAADIRDLHVWSAVIDNHDDGRPIYSDDIKTPAWRKIQSGQRDYQAEDAGY